MYTNSASSQWVNRRKSSRCQLWPRVNGVQNGGLPASGKSRFRSAGKMVDVHGTCSFLRKLSHVVAQRNSLPSKCGTAKRRSKMASLENRMTLYGHSDFN